MFLVSILDGSWRPIINLKALRLASETRWHGCLSILPFPSMSHAKNTSIIPGKATMFMFCLIPSLDTQGIYCKFLYQPTFLVHQSSVFGRSPGISEDFPSTQPPLRQNDPVTRKPRTLSSTPYIDSPLGEYAAK